MLTRNQLTGWVEARIQQFPVVLLSGPRQCGKTTLAREIAQRHNAKFYDLEDPQSPLRPESSGLLLRSLTGLVVIDEFQRMPALFELLRVLSDRRPLPARFLILGSASLDLARGASESLAGRIAYAPMSGFALEEVGQDQWQVLWNRGRFPNSFLAGNDEQSVDWRQNFTQSFLERDLPQLGIHESAPALRRFWTMLAHWHGQTWNASEFARVLGTRQETARRYLDILCGTFMVRQLEPWYANVKKRLVKSPKIYYRDSGLLHAMLGLTTYDQLMAHPRFGFSWEGFVIEEILNALRSDRDAYFYKTHGGAELDLFVMHRGKRIGFEIKFQDAPGTTKGMHIAMSDLELDRLYVVYPGTERYPLDERIEALPLSRIEEALK